MSIHGQCTLEGAWSVSNATCPNASDGSLCCDTLYSLIPGQGLPPYQCQIISPVGSYMYNTITNCFENLSPNTYTIQTTSSDGCIGYGIYTVSTQYAEIVAPTTNNTPATCGGNNGSVCVNVSGGSGNYALAWIGPLPSTTLIATNVSCISNLAPGIYQLNVDDLAPNGCDRFFTKIIGQTNLSLSAASTNTTCPSPNCNGSIDLTASGTAPYTYTWTGPGGLSANTEDLAGLCPGTYTVSVTDANGCTGTAAYTITTEGADVITGGTGNSANVISGNIVWNPAYFGGQTTIIVDADVIVNANAVLTINNLTVLVTPGHRIRANNLASIIANNSTFDVICGDTWHGFEILGGGSTAAITNRGYLSMSNCTTRHAECAIRNHQPGSYPTPTSNTSNFGGNIEALNSLFEDNLFDLELRLFTSNSDNNPCAKFQNCQFRLNNLPATWTTTGSESWIISRQRIYCLGVNRALFFDCRLINTNANYANLYLSNGMQLLNSSIIWGGTNPGEQFIEANYSSLISGWRRGAFIQATTTNSNATFRNTLFQCNQGISVLGPQSVDARNNIFRGYAQPNFIHPNTTAPNSRCLGIRFNNDSFSQLNVNPQSYFIAHNLFAPPTNPNFISAGIHIYSAGSLNNYIIENIFVNCSKGILADLINRNAGGTSGAHYECNTFLSNVSNTQQIQDIEIVGGQNYIGTPTFDRLGTSTPQSRTFSAPFNRSAGNNFINSIDSDAVTGVLLDDVNSGGTNTLPSHTYLVYPPTEVNALHQTLNGSDIVGLPEMTSGAHTPVWQDVDPNMCGYNWQFPIPTIQNLINLRTSKELLESSYNALVDGGDTQSLLFEIEASTYQNALDLFNELMTKSPYLSQEVLIETIQKEYDLPKPLLAIILQNNPQAAKDDKVLKAVEDRNDPLSSYQMSQMLSGKYWFSSKEVLTQQISATQAQIEKELFTLQNTEISWENYCELLDESNPNEAKIKADYLAHHGEISACLNILNTIAQLDGENAATLAPATYTKLLQIQAAYYGNSHVLSAEHHTELLNIWNNNTENLGDLAYFYLIVFAGYEALDEEIKEERSIEYNQAQNDEITQSNTIKLWPNPAQNFIQIQLEQPIIEETQVHVFDLLGKQVAALKLDRLQTELVIDVTELSEGRYVIRIASQADIAPISFLKQ